LPASFCFRASLKKTGSPPTILKSRTKRLTPLFLIYRRGGAQESEREIASICRKVARKKAEGNKELTRVTKGTLHTFLGVPKFIPESEQEHDTVGIATGLAWTQSGGRFSMWKFHLSKERGISSSLGNWEM